MSSERAGFRIAPELAAFAAFWPAMADNDDKQNDNDDEGNQQLNLRRQKVSAEKCKS